MKFFEGAAPQRSGIRKPDPLVEVEEYRRLREMILHGTLPERGAGVIVDKQDAERLGLKYPARTVGDRLRELVRQAERPYRVRKYRIPGGAWSVEVRPVAR